jgi:hypothetical protein
LGAASTGNDRHSVAIMDLCLHAYCAFKFITMVDSSSLWSSWLVDTFALPIGRTLFLTYLVSTESCPCVMCTVPSTIMVYARFSLPSWSVRYRCYHALFLGASRSLPERYGALEFSPQRRRSCLPCGCANSVARDPRIGALTNQGLERPPESAACATAYLPQAPRKFRLAAWMTSTH